MPNIRCPEQEPEMLKKRASQSWLRAVAQTAATHTATGNAAVALPGHSQAFILGTSCFFWQFLLVPTLCNNFGFCLDYNFFAGWSVFFWPAGRILSPFLVPVLGTVFGPCFGHQVVPRYKDY